MPIVNGKKIDLPSSVNERDVLKAAGERRPGRKVVVQKPEGFETIGKHSKVSIDENDKIKIVPDRVKANYTYGKKMKSQFQIDLIDSQLSSLEANMFKEYLETDEERSWFKINNFKLPSVWAEANGFKFCPVMIIIPDDFPNVPPNGFYLPSSIRVPFGRGHVYDRGYGGAFGQDENEANALQEAGWRWYCTHIKPESWCPAPIRSMNDWKKGDNLFDIMSLITDVLTDPTDE